MAQILTLLFHLFLINTLQIQGSSAVTDVFVKTGDDLILNLTEAEIPSNSRFWTWQFKDDMLVEFTRGYRPTVVNSRSGKVEVLEKSYSVKLKTLQKTHSGIYTAMVVSPKVQTLTQYNVTVLDPVSPADLSFTCASSSSSSSFYNLTATCRTDDSSISITLRCEDQTCNQEGGEGRSVTKSGSSLRIYQLKESVICIHSNQVSRTESKVNIENRCIELAEKRTTAIINVTRIILAALLVVVFTLTVVIRKCKRKTEPEEVMYEFPE
ncbi:uncharacterized protein LOC106945592 [Poecilia latipinna]|uniref:uncharacterized protein LOC106941514 n=1 Tax=Poecilia latipinna TaxID=48699 RepID=UPI00072DB824|nr:PREDICTED: uncharacterized protein LOC106941514 [Poecilia latipinna]XP_014884859.1 PREDICTED: uncharacterized protein LOC106945592 [Poecilia latipinna]